MEPSIFVKDLRGLKFGRLTVIAYTGNDLRGKALWRCKCECGKIAIKGSKNLQKGEAKSCDCLQQDRNEQLGSRRRTHGMTNTAEHNTWEAMRQRCNNPNSNAYQYYGGRGIKICDRWLGQNGFLNFFEDMGLRPEGKTLDRYPNKNGDYSKENCRWATKKEQSGNTRFNRWYEYEGERMIAADWARKLKTKPDCFCAYVRKHGFNNAYLFYTYKATVL